MHLFTVTASGSVNDYLFSKLELDTSLGEWAPLPSVCSSSYHYSESPYTTDTF